MEVHHVSNYCYYWLDPAPVGGVTPKTIKVPTDYATIQAGINAASKGDTVLVADGTYYENINFKGKTITVASYYLVDGDTTHINNAIINGSRLTDINKTSVVSFISGEDTTSVICGFTITGGTGDLIAERVRGGGICFFCSGARIAHNKIISNLVAAVQRVYSGEISAEDTVGTHLVIIEINLIQDSMAWSFNE